MTSRNSGENPRGQPFSDLFRGGAPSDRSGVETRPPLKTELQGAAAEWVLLTQLRPRETPHRPRFPRVQTREGLPAQTFHFVFGISELRAAERREGLPYSSCGNPPAPLTHAEINFAGGSQWAVAGRHPVLITRPSEGLLVVVVPNLSARHTLRKKFVCSSPTRGAAGLGPGGRAFASAVAEFVCRRDPPTFHTL